MKKINIYVPLFLLMSVLFLGVLFFSLSRNNAREINKIDVEFITENNHFLSQRMVKNFLLQNSLKSLPVKKNSINLFHLENSVYANKTISYSEMFLDIDGTLRVKIGQRFPVARIEKGGEFCYIDKNGVEFPLSSVFSSRVPVVFGNITPKNENFILKMLNLISDDNFLKSSISAIVVKANQNVELRVRDYDYRIDFGYLENIEKKFQNYKAFVHYAQRDSLIEKYKLIDLRFDTQVICSK